jgi:hypothetical protein
MISFAPTPSAVKSTISYGIRLMGSLGVPEERRTPRVEAGRLD